MGKMVLDKEIRGVKKKKKNKGKGYIDKEFKEGLNELFVSSDDEDEDNISEVKKKKCGS